MPMMTMRCIDSLFIVVFFVDFLSVAVIEKPVDCFLNMPSPTATVACHIAVTVLLHSNSYYQQLHCIPPKSQLILAFLLAFLPLSSTLPLLSPVDCCLGFRHPTSPSDAPSHCCYYLASKQKMFPNNPTASHQTAS